jgi:uncharacterized protein (DUF58 family)
MGKKFLESEFLQKLESLSIVARKVFRGQLVGERTSLKKGRSGEFADYRGYQMGDDFRYVDWNIYGRLGKLFVKLFREEEDLPFHLLVDASQSMAFGNPAKFEYALKIAAALSYISLINLDRVRLFFFSSHMQKRMGPVRGRSEIFHLFKFLEEMSCSGGTQFNQFIKNYAREAKNPGVAVVISDLLDSGGYSEGLLALRYHKYDVFLMQVVCEDELVPAWQGDLKLVDSETKEKCDITITPELLKRYRETGESYFKEIDDFCGKHEIDYLQTCTTIPLEDLILKYLRQGGLLK